MSQCFYHDEQMRSQIQTALNMDNGPVDIALDYARGDCPNVKPFVFQNGAILRRHNTCAGDKAEAFLVAEYKGETYESRNVNLTGDISLVDCWISFVPDRPDKWRFRTYEAIKCDAEQIRMAKDWVRNAFPATKPNEWIWTSAEVRLTDDLDSRLTVELPWDTNPAPLDLQRVSRSLAEISLNSASSALPK